MLSGGALVVLCLLILIGCILLLCWLAYFDTLSYLLALCLPSTACTCLAYLFINHLQLVLDKLADTAILATNRARQDAKASQAANRIAFKA